MERQIELLLKAYQEVGKKSVLVFKLIDVYVQGLTQEINMDLELLIIYNVFKLFKLLEKQLKGNLIYRYCRYVKSIAVECFENTFLKTFKCSIYRYCRSVNQIHTNVKIAVKNRYCRFVLQTPYNIMKLLENLSNVIVLHFIANTTRILYHRY